MYRDNTFVLNFVQHVTKLDANTFQIIFETICY